MATEPALKRVNGCDNLYGLFREEIKREHTLKKIENQLCKLLGNPVIKEKREYKLAKINIIFKGEIKRNVFKK